MADTGGHWREQTCRSLNDLTHICLVLQPRTPHGGQRFSGQHLIVTETEGIPPERAHIYAVPHDPEDDWRFYLPAKFQVSVSNLPSALCDP